MADIFSGVVKPLPNRGWMDMGEGTSGSLFTRDHEYSAFGGPRFSMRQHVPSALDGIRSQIWDFDSGSEVNTNYRYIVKVDRLDIT
jgi:hypothetical protein